MKKIPIFSISFCLLLLTAVNVHSQEANRDSLVKAALEIIHETHYCALVTVDSESQPQIRTMNPFPMKDEIVIWFATSRDSRKVREIRNNPKVNVYWADHVNAKGYVNITGTAEVIDDKELLVKMKRDYWEGMTDWKEVFVLIKIVPKTLEVINYKHNLNNDPKTFKAPVVVM
jgi:general stress protein 26